MVTTIAIEGIDRIGKSSFIAELEKAIRYTFSHSHKILSQKPAIGINNLHKLQYPLSQIPYVMEIRNIGLMEEYCEQCELRQNSNEIIIRDRFNLSELAYGNAIRPNTFRDLLHVHDEPLNIYKKWNKWFEKKMDQCSNVLMIVFVLDEGSYPNQDEILNPETLIKVNESFKKVYDECEFKNKHLVHLTKDPETGLTNIMDNIEWIVRELKKSCE